MAAAAAAPAPLSEFEAGEAAAEDFLRTIARRANELPLSLPAPPSSAGEAAAAYASPVPLLDFDSLNERETSDAASSSEDDALGEDAMRRQKYVAGVAHRFSYVMRAVSALPASRPLDKLVILQAFANTVRSVDGIVLSRVASDTSRSGEAASPLWFADHAALLDTVRAWVTQRLALVRQLVQARVRIPVTLVPIVSAVHVLRGVEGLDAIMPQ